MRDEGRMRTGQCGLREVGVEDLAVESGDL